MSVAPVLSTGGWSETLGSKFSKIVQLEWAKLKAAGSSGFVCAEHLLRELLPAEEDSAVIAYAICRHIYGGSIVRVPIDGNPDYFLVWQPNGEGRKSRDLAGQAPTGTHYNADRGWEYHEDFLRFATDAFPDFPSRVDRFVAQLTANVEYKLASYGP